MSTPRNLTINEQAIIAIMDATGCPISQAKTAAFEHHYVPDAIAYVEKQQRREHEREEKRRRLSPEDMAERIDSLEEQLAALWDYVYKLGVKP